MGRVKNDFSELKRKSYLILLPFILLSSLVTFFVRMSNEQYGFEFYINVLFIAVFSIGWFAAYFNYWRKFFELFILLPLLFYYWMSIYLTVQGAIANERFLGNGMFIIWLPLLLMYIFGVFKRRTAILVSIFVFVSSILPVLFHVRSLRGPYIEMFVQLYIATIIYIIIIIYAFKLFESYLENRFMKQQLYLDPLTQIGNRYQINEWLTSYLENAEKTPFSVVFVDIDHFKEINDTFGHVVGDEALQEVVSVIQTQITEQQHFGRWGGEEFVLFTSLAECEAFTLAETLRGALEQHTFNEIGQVTASFGVTSYEQGDTVQSILKRVDDKLYESKRKGRNRVTGKF